VHYLRPEVVETLKVFRPTDAKPDRWAFRGFVPRVPTFKRDLAAAGIPFKDERGRRLDLHALRKTFGTLLSASGVSPRVAMELMRHSDMKLTMGIYTDVTQLPLVQEAARLPSFRVAKNDALGDASSHEKAAGVVTSRFPKLERAKRLELSTSTLARWCSTN